MVTSASGTVEQVVHYYPFGGQFADGTAASLQEFKFTGKEWDSSKGQNLYDFGARTYDPALLRWTTPDPLSSKYPAWSPYAYCGNSPALFVDPEGKDIWEIDRDGNILRKEGSKRTFLYAQNEEGNRTSRFIALSSDDILNCLESPSSTIIIEKQEKLLYKAQSGRANDVFKLFLFASKNSDVEWVVHKTNSTYTIGTAHTKQNAGSFADYGVSKADASIHSHPETTSKKEMESMGVPRFSGEGVQGDWANVIRDYRENGRITRHNYVYFPETNRLYYVRANYEPHFIKSINSYRDFYFGVLNYR